MPGLEDMINDIFLVHARIALNFLIASIAPQRLRPSKSSRSLALQ